MTAMDRADADIAAGRLWLARQRLSSYLVERPDGDVIAKLAEVHLAMGDLPAAGALLFVLGRDDDAARSAIAAWRRQNGGPSAQWRSIPRALRTTSVAPHVARLKAEALASSKTRGDRSLDHAHPMSTGERLTDIGCTLLVLCAAVLFLITFVCGLGVVFEWLGG